MPRAIYLLLIASAAAPLLIGCGNGNTGIGTCSGAGCPAIITPVSLSMTDTPPSGVSVLSFQVKLSAATL